MMPDLDRPASRKDRMPRAVAHYAIQDRVGKGAMAVVYRAIDQRNGREVALKVMAADLEGDQETQDRFFHEAQIATQLRHQNVVAVLDSGEDDGRLYIAMELLAGSTLTEFLKQPEAADLEARIDIMIQICQGLLVAHGAGIYHRDIKPANLFVCLDRRVKILDFGVARLAGSNITRTGYVLGTPDYMSPEQARGKKIDGRSDVFSAAAVFYVMVTGRKPFAASHLPAVIHNVLHAEPLPIRPDEAPEQLIAVIRKGLSKEVELRHQNVAQMVSELMAAGTAWVARTRRKAAAVRTLAEELVVAGRRRTELSTALELPLPGDEPWNTLVSQYPMLRRGPSTLGAFPFRAGVIHQVDLTLRASLDTLRPHLASLELGHAQWREGVAKLNAQDLEGAATLLASARRKVPGSGAITRAAAGCAAAIEQRREQSALLQSRLKMAEEAAIRHDWAALVAIADEIDEIDPGNLEAEGFRAHARLSVEAERDRQSRQRAQRVADTAIAEARRASIEGRFDDAVACLRAQLDKHPGTSGIPQAIEQIERDRRTAELRVEREESKRTQMLASQAIAAARQAAEEGRFDDAIATLGAHLDTYPRAPGVAQAIEQIDSDRRAAGERAEQKVQEHERVLATQAITEARRASKAGHFDDATAQLRDYLAAHPRAPGVAQAIDQIEGDRRDASLRAEEQARERAQLAASRVIVDARQKCERGEFDDALAALQAHLQAHVGALGIAEAVEEIRREKRTAEERADRLAKASRLAGEAKALLEADDLPKAEACAAQAVGLNAEDRDFRHLLEGIRAAAKLRKERDERERKVTELIEHATRLGDGKSFAKALAAVDKALVIDVGHVRAADLRARLAADAAVHEAALQAEAMRQRRLRAAAPALREAQKALAAGDMARAKWAAENALAQAPGSPEILALLADITAKTPAKTDEDTAILLVDDGTVRIVPVAGSLQDVAADLRDRASTLLRRWQAPKG